MIFRELNVWKQYTYLPTRTELYVFEAGRVVMLYGRLPDSTPYYRGTVSPETVLEFEYVYNEWAKDRAWSSLVPGLDFPVPPKCKSGCCCKPSNPFKDLLTRLKGKCDA